MLLFATAVSFGQLRVHQSVYPRQANVITISHSEDKGVVNDRFRKLLLDEGYKIRKEDPSIETEEKYFSKFVGRIQVDVLDNSIQLRGWVRSALNPNPAEHRSTFWGTKFFLMRHGFDEMERLADIYKAKYNGSISGYIE